MHAELSDAAITRTEPIRRRAVGRWRVELLPRQSYTAQYTPDNAVIGFAFEPQEGMHAFAGDRARPFRTKPNSLAFVPVGCEVFSRSPAGGEYLRLTVAGRSSDVARAETPVNGIVDPVAIAAAQALRALLLDGDAFDPLVFEHHAMALVERVDRHLHGGGETARAQRWMTSRRLRLIDDMIEADLDKGLCVTDLAQALGLSEGFFSRAFKAAVGKAPHDYIIDRRIARARALICAGERDLSAVAFACGFSSHAHMTTAFRRRLAVTPSALRRDIARLRT